MRTPWRFIADLVSREVPEDPKSDLGSPAPEIAAIEYNPAEQEKPKVASAERPTASKEPALSPEQDTTGIEPKADPAQEPGIIGETVTASTDQRNSVSGDAPDNRIAEKTPSSENGIGKGEVVARASGATKSRKAKQSPRPISVKGVAESDVAEASLPNIEKAPTDAMVELDHEIAELRRALTNKLASQNAQLKAMLQRYDR